MHHDREDGEPGQAYGHYEDNVEGKSVRGGLRGWHAEVDERLFRRPLKRPDTGLGRGDGEAEVGRGLLQMLWQGSPCPERTPRQEASTFQTRGTR